jgi:hypothetical protein
MNRFLCVALVVFLNFSTWAQEKPDSKKLQQLAETYHSRLAHMQLVMESPDRDRARASMLMSQPVGGLLQDAFGGFSYSPQIYQGIWTLLFRKSSSPFSLREQPPELSDEKTINPVNIEPFRLPVPEKTVELERSVPAGFHLVPANLFVTQLNRPIMVDRLEACMVEYGSLLTYGLGVNLQFQKALAGHLGLADFTSLSEVAQEVYFVSEEVSLKPAANFAVLLQTQASLESLRERLGTQTVMAKIDDYLVIATSEKLLEAIRATHNGEFPSMASQQDFRTSYFALQEPRDGFVFVSTAFIERLLSPQLWLLNQQRPEMLGRLSFAQYEALAFRCSHGEWPKPDQLELIKGLALQVDKNGMVFTEEVGSIYDPKPLSDMPVQYFSEKDKYDYEQFKKAPSLWAPFGIALGLSDKLWLQTDFTPFELDDSAELFAATGEEGVTFASLKGFPQIAPLQVHVSLDFKEIFSQLFKIESEAPDAKERINKKLQVYAGENFDFFKTFENRVSLSIEVSEKRRIDSFQSALNAVQSGYGIFVLSFHVTDLASCENLLTSVERLGGEQPVTKFEGIEATPLNLYIVRAYLVTDPKHIHLAFSDASAQRLCETISSKGSESPVLISDPQQCLVQLNVSLALERVLEKQENVPDQWSEDFRKEMVENHKVASEAEFEMNKQLSYLIDMKMLQEALGPSADAETYFRYPPRQIMNIPVEFKNKEIYIDGRPLEEVWGDPAARTETMKNLVEKHKARVREHIGKLGIVQIGIEYNEKRLFTRLTTELPSSLDVIDTTQGPGTSRKWAFGALAVLLLGLLTMAVTKRRK